MRTYKLDVVGGKHDGVQGMYWADDGDHPPPARIIVGTCAGRGECAGGSLEWCRQAARAVNATSFVVRHPAYWAPEEDTLPLDGQPYRLVKEEAAAAVYVVAGAPLGELEGEEEFTVDAILAARPRLPEPVTALGRELVERAKSTERHKRYWPRVLAPRGWIGWL